ncbi:VOC family protein [Deinococcus peraridilitoris]|uniref:Putative ring-cleavage extradiol dioxygenase n=1 Tax=Deinococcus peraridilitoris (strain DSM 19664 / LMG 22246 / CIP 109416 / KR-200) TaxID=937777 RepID=L0A2B9_DEIPD|nr:VOC family protein [Deinococcus peraridilitoris]AFZ67332.1 putative ring-cleavage extradiol dioxygenase [Deinococcus peraridilitoris DSM 19664]
MTTPALHPHLQLGPVELSIADLARSADFYQRALGLAVLKQDGQRLELGVPGRPLLVLHERSGAPMSPRNSPGLYHFALLLPSRADLGRWLQHAARLGLRLGQSDHLVSEAFYLSDPDGHGIEVYRDRPRGEWQWNAGEVRMASDPIDIQGLVSESGAQLPWTGAPEGTVMGHIHLRVRDLAATEAFYTGVLGFDVVARWPGALFVSVGGYHHHFGLNTWQSENGPDASPQSAKLERAWLRLPDGAAVHNVTGRLRSAEVPFTEEGSVLSVRDPAGNLLSFTV